MAKHRTVLGKIFGSLADSFTSGLNSLGGLFGSFFNRFTGAGLTEAQKDSAALEYTYQQRLNDQEFERKKEFYNMYESPAAMVRQYKNAGLNPMLLAGGGASQSATGGIGSAGSVDVPDSGSLDPSALLSAITGLVMKNKEMKIGQQNADTAKYNAETQRLLADADINLKEKQATRQGIENEYLPELFGVQIAEGKAGAKQKEAQAAQLKDIILSQECQRRLTEKNIELVDAQKAVQEYQAAVLKAQSEHADAYYKALADYQGSMVTLTTLQASGQGLNNEFLRRTLQTRISSAETELNHLIIQTGMDSEIFTGEAFKRQVEGKMTNAEKWQMWTGVGTSILGTAASFAAPQIAAARVAGGMVNAATSAPRGIVATPYHYNYNPSTRQVNP